MCESCGCANHTDHSHDDAGHSHIEVDVNQSLFEANDAIAKSNREHFDKKGIVAINLISSPGSGKTTLLEYTIEALHDKLKIGVIEGDIETERDADRIRAKGVPAVQLTTGGACHLDANMTHKGFHKLEHELGDAGLDLLFIENVGNLVCPTSFDLGEHQRIVLVSVPEGSDKPAKYPKAFTSSDVFLITKTDLLPYFDFSVDEARQEAMRLNPDIKIMDFSTKSGDNFQAWIEYLLALTGK